MTKLELSHGGKAWLLEGDKEAKIVLDFRPHAKEAIQIDAQDLSSIFFDLVLPWYLRNFEVPAYERRN